eukprot:scaffold32804_cov37-Attheya_sp.AAC.1
MEPNRQYSINLLATACWQNWRRFISLFWAGKRSNTGLHFKYTNYVGYSVPRFSKAAPVLEK